MGRCRMPTQICIDGMYRHRGVWLLSMVSHDVAAKREEILASIQRKYLECFIAGSCRAVVVSHVPMLPALIDMLVARIKVSLRLGIEH